MRTFSGHSRLLSFEKDFLAGLDTASQWIEEKLYKTVLERHFNSLQPAIMVS